MYPVYFPLEWLSVIFALITSRARFFQPKNRNIFKSKNGIATMKAGKKITGGRYHRRRKKRLHEKHGQPRQVKLGVEKKKILKGRGNRRKTVVLSTSIANVTDKSGKTKKAQIKNVLETPSNKFLARQNILVKSAIIETELGKARITNRPSQEGSVHAVLIE